MKYFCHLLSFYRVGKKRANRINQYLRIRSQLIASDHLNSAVLCVFGSILQLMAGGKLRSRDKDGWLGERTQFKDCGCTSA
jgi:hypothetical protein